MKSVIVLIDNEGNKSIRDLSISPLFLFKLIQHGNIETIAFGEVDEVDGVVWEKQFKQVTVMPSDFGGSK